MTSLFEPAPVIALTSCAIEDCGRPDMCDACAILFGPYDALLIRTKEWDPADVHAPADSDDTADRSTETDDDRGDAGCVEDDIDPGDPPRSPAGDEGAEPVRGGPDGSAAVPGKPPADSEDDAVTREEVDAV